MYTVSDIVELGEAHVLIVSFLKQFLIMDDIYEFTFWIDDDPWD